MMVKTCLLFTAVTMLVVPVCYGAVGQAGEGGLHAQIGQGSENASGTPGTRIGQTTDVGWGIADQVRSQMANQNAVGASVGMPQRIQERLANRLAAAAGNPPEESEAADSEAAGPDTETSDEAVVNGAHRPFFISGLIDAELVTQDQVDEMRTAGAGWGAIRISTLLADRINETTEPTETVETTETTETTEPTETATMTPLGIFNTHQDGMGFGQIALTHELKPGHLLVSAN
ncbi:MAG: hypothetical protein JW993_20545 [Sedimentisphaerales bacterium]|nr:hypothetical protein [Sedimentisphaerales bacterium]